jgi:hypothetical protein
MAVWRDLSVIAQRTRLDDAVFCPGFVAAARNFNVCDTMIFLLKSLNYTVSIAVLHV